jgi:lactate 2-monooxygenase
MAEEVEEYCDMYTWNDGMREKVRVMVLCALNFLRYTKAAGFTVLMLTLDRFLLSWHPHDLDTAYLPFTTGVGVQVGTSNLVFMQQQQVPPCPDECPMFLFNQDTFCMRLAMGNKQACEVFVLGTGWLHEANSAIF